MGVVANIIMLNAAAVGGDLSPGRICEETGAPLMSAANRLVPKCKRKLTIQGRVLTSVAPQNVSVEEPIRSLKCA